MPLFVSTETFNGELTVGQRSAVVVLGISTGGDGHRALCYHKPSEIIAYCIPDVGNVVTVFVKDLDTLGVNGII